MLMNENKNELKSQAAPGDAGGFAATDKKRLHCY